MMKRGASTGNIIMQVISFHIKQEDLELLDKVSDIDKRARASLIRKAVSSYCKQFMEDLENES